MWWTINITLHNTKLDYRYKSVA